MPKDLKSWDDILCATGKTIEDIGRNLRGKGRKKPKVWTIEDLTHIHNALTSCVSVIEVRINSLKG